MVRGALIGVGVAVVGLLIPGVHVVTGPLGPLAGGYIGGQSLESPDEAQALGMGLLMGVVLAALSLPVTLIVALVTDTMLLLAATPAIGVYAAGLGVVGALLGTRSRRAASRG